MTKQEFIAKELCGRYYFGVQQGYEICVKAVAKEFRIFGADEMIEKASKINKENLKKWPQFMDDAQIILDKLAEMV